MNENTIKRDTHRFHLFEYALNIEWYMYNKQDFIQRKQIKKLNRWKKRTKNECERLLERLA